MSKYTFLYLFFQLCFFIGLGQTCGADQSHLYLPMLKGKRVGLVVNQTAQVGKVHLVDFLKSKQVTITGIFAPEHGFRGDHSAGEKVKTNVDPKTGITVYSLYGNQKNPSKEVLAKMDVLIFDIQDGGARF